MESERVSGQMAAEPPEKVSSSAALKTRFRILREPGTMYAIIGFPPKIGEDGGSADRCHREPGKLKENNGKWTTKAGWWIKLNF